MGVALEFIRGRGWRVSALVVGVLGLFVGAWATVALDTEEGWSPLAIAVGFIGVVTLLLIPRTHPGPHNSNAGPRDAERRST